MQFATIWLELEDILLSEVSQKKDKQDNLTFLWYME